MLPRAMSIQGQITENKDTIGKDNKTENTCVWVQSKESVQNNEVSRLSGIWL